MFKKMMTFQTAGSDAASLVAPLSSPDMCNLAAATQQTSPRKSNSSSPTDIWALTFRPGSIRRQGDDGGGDDGGGRSFEVGILKWFLPEASGLSPLYAAKVKGLRYEARIYAEVTNPLLSNNICPNFVRYIGGSDDCTFETLLAVLQADPKFQSSTKGELLTALEANLWYMTHSSDKIIQARPTLEDQVGWLNNGSRGHYRRSALSTVEAMWRQSFIRLHRLSSRFYPAHDVRRISMILTELTTTHSFYDYLQANKRRLETPEVQSEVWSILFQIVCACYAMRLSQMTHHDLHVGNILIRKHDKPVTRRYNYNRKSYTVTSTLTVLIYDFDRSYAKRLGSNEYLEYEQCEKIGSCNYVVPTKDVAKVWCYILLYFHDMPEGDTRQSTLNSLCSCIIPDSNRSFIDQMVMDRQCFFRGGGDVTLPPRFFSQMRPLSGILERVSLHLPDPDPDPEPDLDPDPDPDQPRPDPDQPDPVRTYTCNPDMFNDDGSIGHLTTSSYSSR